MKSKLKELIAASVGDGKVSGKELKAILKEAKIEGYSEDDIDIIINDELRKAKGKNSKKANENEMKFGCFSFLFMLISFIGLLLTLSLFFLVSARWGLMMMGIFVPLWFFFYYKSKEAIVTRRQKYVLSSFDFYRSKIGYANRMTFGCIIIYMFVFYAVGFIAGWDMAKEFRDSIPRTNPKDTPQRHKEVYVDEETGEKFEFYTE